MGPILVHISQTGQVRDSSKELLVLTARHGPYLSLVLAATHIMLVVVHNRHATQSSNACKYMYGATVIILCPKERRRDVELCMHGIFPFLLIWQQIPSMKKMVRAASILFRTAPPWIQL
jgi:hypothetical protein